MEGIDPPVRVFVEDNLLTDQGYRNSYALRGASCGWTSVSACAGSS